MANAPGASSDDPGPFMLGGSRGEDPEVTRLSLRYLAVAYRSQKGMVAPVHFVSPLGPYRFAYAQARVYNPTAFDTFTQDWRVTLEPASMVEDNTLVGGLGHPDVLAEASKKAASAEFGKGTGMFTPQGHASFRTGC
jgi:hypothetical protein